MTRDECKKILMTIEVLYPNFKIENMTGTINSWFIILQDYDYKMIEAGLKIFTATSGSAFAPSVSELIAYARKPQELKQTDAATAWVQVRKAIRNGIYHAGEEFDNLPEDVQRVVGSPNQIYTWALMESREIDSVVCSNFRKAYETMQKRDNDLKALPQNIQNLLQQTEQKMLTAI